MNSKPNYFVTKHAEAVAELKARGFPVPEALTSDDPQPLALTTREDIARFITLIGGGAVEARLLGMAVAALVRTPKYIEALAADLSTRVSIITLEPVEPVSENDRLSASLQLYARALRNAPKPPAVRDAAPKPAVAEDAAPPRPKPPPPQVPRPPPPPPPAAQKAALATPVPTPFRNGGPLSAAEVERRKQALASVRPKTPA